MQWMIVLCFKNMFSEVDKTGQAHHGETLCWARWLMCAMGKPPGIDAEDRLFVGMDGLEKQKLWML